MKYLIVYSSAEKTSKEILNRLSVALNNSETVDSLDVTTEEYPHIIFGKIRNYDADIIIDINAAGTLCRTELFDMSYTILRNKVLFIVDEMKGPFFEETFNLSHFVCVTNSDLYDQVKERRNIPNLYYAAIDTNEDITQLFDMIKKEMEFV